MPTLTGWLVARTWANSSTGRWPSFAACCAPATDHQPTFGNATAQQDLQAAGRKLPLTLHPIRVLERPMPRAADV